MRFSSLAAKRRYALKSPALAFLKLNMYACQPHTRCTLNWVWQGGREGATEDGGWEGGNKGRVATERGRGAIKGGPSETGRQGGRETSREVPWWILANILYTVHKTTHNAALALDTLVLKIVSRYSI